MKKNDIIREIIRLNNLIKIYDNYYFIKNEPLVSDSYYDYLYQKLVNLEKENPGLKIQESQVNRIGGIDITEEAKGLYAHKKKMYSLNKCYSDVELSMFINNLKKIKKDVKFVCEEKIDGISISLIYEYGLLKRCVTRGDGETGHLINNVLENIRSLPQYVNSSLPYLDVRGELYITKSEFRKLNKENKENKKIQYSNTRNCVAGLIFKKEAFESQLDYFAYAIGYPVVESEKTQEQTLIRLRNLGFFVNLNMLVIDSISDFKKYYNDILQKRKEMNYEIDGIVIKANDLFLHKVIGFTDKYPKCSIAYKFPGNVKETVLRNIVNTVSRYGTITPIAIFDSVEISNVSISKATLSNFKKIVNLDVRLGDTILLERSGDVIPKIISVNKLNRSGNEVPHYIPSVCPSCGQNLIVNDDLSYAHCNNSNLCKAQQEQHLIHFCSKNAFNIDGVGETKLKQLYKENIITNVLDLFSLEEDSNEKRKILNLRGWGKISSIKLFEAIKKSKRIKLSNFIYSLNIKSVGKVTSQELATYYLSADRLELGFNHFSSDEIKKIKNKTGLGESSLRSVKMYLSNERNLHFFNQLIKIVSIAPNIQLKNSLQYPPFYNKSIVITGTLNQPRRSVEGVIKNNGGIIKRDVSKGTDFLIVGDKPGSKYKKAQDLGIKIINTAEFEKLMDTDKKDEIA